MKRAVVNILPYGADETEHRLTTTNHRWYAQKCGAEYFLLQSDQQDSSKFSHRYLANVIAERFDQTLYLESGCVVAAICPDIFSEVPAGFWGVIDECGLSRFHTIEEDQTQRYANILCDNENWPYVYLSRHISSGVLLLPKDSKDFYYPPAISSSINYGAIDRLWLSINLQLHDVGLRELDRRFDWSWKHRRFYEDMEHAFIINLSEMPDRIVLLRQLVSQIAGA